MGLELVKIKEVIVVEGRDDETAVKRAVDAEIIITHGFGIKESTFKLIKAAQKRCGVIVLTDPDHAGEQIRKRISDRIPGVKHAFISRSLATKDDDIGVENASPETILAGLEKAHMVTTEKMETFTKTDLLKHDLIISEKASSRRDHLGMLLGIGYGNAKTFLKRLNHYGVSRDEFEAAVIQLDKNS
jgi:ribonuclease M5